MGAAMADCGVVVALVAGLVWLSTSGTEAVEELGCVASDCGMVEAGAAGGIPRAPTIAQCQSFESLKLPPNGSRKMVVLSGALFPLR